MNCYVYPPELSGKYSLPKEIMDKSITLFYPEAGMTTNQLFTTAPPRDFHIVTDSPFLVPLYSMHNVFICENGKWVNPRFQTYGCAYTTVMRLWKENRVIPSFTFDGKVTNCMGNEIKYK
jgi:hypothetical protein